MTNSIHAISISFMLIVLGGATFHRLTRSTTPEGARLLWRPSGRLALMGIFLTVANVMTVQPIYQFIDSHMFVSNGTSAIAQILAMTAVALLGMHLAISYKSDFALRWIVGVRGALALLVASLGAFAALIASDSPDHSPRLVAYLDQSAVQAMHWIALTYFAYVMGILFRPVLHDSHVNPLRLTRVGSRLILFGFVLSIGRALAFPWELETWPHAFYGFEVISQVSAVCIVIGLWMFAYTRTHGVARQKIDAKLPVD
jgi:hypothetical protein